MNPINDSPLMRVAADIKEQGFAPMAKVYGALMALLEPAAKEAPDLAHALSELSRLVIHNYPQWLKLSLAPYSIEYYTFAPSPAGASLGEIARVTILAAFASLNGVIEVSMEEREEDNVEIPEYFAALDLVDKLQLAALESFNARLAA